MTRAWVRVDPRLVDDWTTAMQRAVADGLTETAATAARRIGVITAASEPGEPYVSLDDLVVITTSWAAVVDGVLTPLIEQVYRGAGLAWTLALEAAGLGWDVSALPPITSQTAIDYLTGATNRLRRVADELWFEAREQLIAGFRAGESIPELAARVREAARITSDRRATTIARTEVISASNAGSLATARLLGVDIEKVWEATEDSRTRPSHVEAHGQQVPIDAKFEVGTSKLDFPGDPDGPPEEIINCRCTIVYDVPDAPEQSDPVTAGGAMPERPVTAAADGPMTGAMVALIPRQSDIDRLAFDGGEPPDQLHLTLAYLGKADDIPAEARTALVARVAALAADTPPVPGDGFAVSVFNPGSDETAIVLGVSGAELERVHGLVADAAAEPPGFAMPEQHAPWIPHVTLAYADDAGLVEKLTDRTGPIEFDHLRVAFAGEAIDVPLGGLTAAALSSLLQLHLKGQHDQSTHGSGGGGPKPSVVYDDDDFDDELNDAEMRSLRLYTGMAYNEINYTLRSGQEKVGGTLGPIGDLAIKNIDNAFKKMEPTKKKMTVYRGVRASDGFPPDDLPPGTVMRDQAYASTSKSKGDHLARFTSGALFEIDVPKGSRVIDFTEWGLSEHESEDEVLLPRGTAWKVLGEKRDRDGTRIIRVRVVND